MVQHLLASEGAIDLLSAMSSLLFALVIYSLLRNARILQAEQWAKPFADTFLVLAILYFLILVNYHRLTQLHLPPPIPIADPINSFIALCSGVTNYLFLLSAFLLSEAAMNPARILGIKKWLVGRPYFRSPLLWLLCIVGLVGALGDRAEIPDTIVSAIALLLMGFALYKNRVRTNKFIAWVAMVSSVTYAAGYILIEPAVFNFFIRRFLPDTLGNSISTVKEPLTGLVFLVLKFGLFFSGYSLMLLVSGPLQEIESLLRNVTKKDKEYLESDGIVRSIREEFGLGSVRLYIKLPGSEELALYDYPSSNRDDKLAPLILPYREGETYDRVITSGQAYPEHRESSYHWIFPTTYKIGVPVFFHDSVIACLEAEVGKEKFTEGSRINLERIASLISPAVQSFREMAALNKISQDLAQLQIGVTSYDMDRDVKGITRIVHDVLSPLATGISIEAGFKGYQSSYSEEDSLPEIVEQRLSAGLSREDTNPENGPYRWLPGRLTISVAKSGDQRSDAQLFGKFLFVTDRRSKRRKHPTVGTNATSLHAVSDLLTDTLLGFIRGHLNEITDKLGVGLTGSEVTSVAAWRSEVEKTAREAGLQWVVARYPDLNGNKFLGETTMVELIKSLEGPEHEAKWERKKGPGLWLYKPNPSEPGETFSIIKKVLKASEETFREDTKNSQATLWLGVARPGFGPELDYVSPWNYFLDHFCDIADSALLRILLNKRQRRRMAEVQSIIAGTWTIRSLVHQLIGDARLLVTTSTEFVNAIDDKVRYAASIQDLQEQRAQIEGSLPKFTDIYKRDLQRPCLLHETVKRALERLRYSLNNYDIAIENNVPENAYIDIPFDDAANALAIVVDNAKDALRDKGNKGRIEINVRETTNKIVCDITDDGRGVPSAIQQTLLKEVSKSDKQNSHGVGLLFSVDLLRWYKGDIVLTHPGPEPRTTFSIWFPKAKRFPPKSPNENGHEG
jgi:signal transduction histidine kinase